MSPHAALARLRAGRHRTPLLVLGVVFVVSRAAAYAAGVRFDSTPVGAYWQVLDPDLLSTRLAESLFYLHSQPPLFNLYVGLLLKAFPDHYASVAQGTHLALGIVGALALYGLLVSVGRGRWASVAVTVLVVVAPATILYESWLFYEHPVAVCLVFSGFALAAFVRTGSFWPGFFFFLLLAILILMRSTFQIVWMLIVVGFVLVAFRDRTRLVLRACLVPLLLVVALYVKNVAVFGLPSTSSWFGMSMAEKLFTSVSLSERARRVERGELSRVSVVRPFSGLDAYRGRVPLARPTGIPVLDETALPIGTPNFNNKSYLRISDLYLRDSLHLIREEPAAYGSSIVKALKVAFRPASDYGRTHGKSALHSYTQGFNRGVYLQTRHAGGIGLAILGAYALALLYGLRLLRRWIAEGSRPALDVVTLLYLWLTVVYVSLVLALREPLENDRIRFEADALVAVLAACAVAEAWRALRRRLPLNTDRASADQSLARETARRARQ